MAMVNIHAAKTRLSEVVDQAAAGEEIVIARAGKPVARLVALETGSPLPPRVLGTMAGRLRVPDDFDTMYQQEIIDMFEGR